MYVCMYHTYVCSYMYMYVCVCVCVCVCVHVCVCVCNILTYTTHTHHTHTVYSFAPVWRRRRLRYGTCGNSSSWI